MRVKCHGRRQEWGPQEQRAESVQVPLFLMSSRRKVHNIRESCREELLSHRTQQPEPRRELLRELWTSFSSLTLPLAFVSSPLSLTLYPGYPDIGFSLSVFLSLGIEETLLGCHYCGCGCFWNSLRFCTSLCLTHRTFGLPLR